MKCQNCLKKIVALKQCSICKAKVCSYSCLEIHYITNHKTDDTLLKTTSKEKSQKSKNQKPKIINSPFLIKGIINDFIFYDPLYKIDNFSPVFEDDGKAKRIGSGSFGQVYLAYNNINKKKYAIKHMEKQKLINILHSLNGIYKEIEIQSIAEHPNIVKLLNAEEDDETFDLVMEYAKNGNLFHFIRKNKGLSEDCSFSLFIQVVNAINFLHSNDLIHRDIKPENILLYDNNIVKLCDFGWCVKLNGEERGTYCGTTEYMSPELVNHKEYSKEIDVWSLGILLYEMIHGYSPFRPNKPKFNEKDVIENIKSYKLKFGKKVSNDCKELILHLLDMNKNRRYKVEDIYRSNFVRRYAEPNLRLNQISNNTNNNLNNNNVKNNINIENNNNNSCTINNITNGNNNENNQKKLFELMREPKRKIITEKMIKNKRENSNEFKKNMILGKCKCIYANHTHNMSNNINNDKNNNSLYYSEKLSYSETKIPKLKRNKSEINLNTIVRVKSLANKQSICSSIIKKLENSKTKTKKINRNKIKGSAFNTIQNKSFKMYEYGTNTLALDNLDESNQLIFIDNDLCDYHRNKLKRKKCIKKINNLSKNKEKSNLIKETINSKSKENKTYDTKTENTNYHKTKKIYDTKTNLLTEKHMGIYVSSNIYSINVPKLPSNAEKSQNKSSEMQENNISSNNNYLSQRLNISTNYDNVSNNPNKNSNSKTMKNTKKNSKYIPKINSINLNSDTKNKTANQGMKTSKENINKYYSYNSANKTNNTNNNNLIENSEELINTINNKANKSPLDKIKKKANPSLKKKTRKSPDTYIHNNNIICNNFYINSNIPTNDKRKMKKFIQTNKNFISETNSKNVSPIGIRSNNNSNSKAKKTFYTKKEFIDISNVHNVIKYVSSNGKIKRLKSADNEKNRDISYKGKIVHNNSDLESDQLKKLNNNILINSDIKNELKMIMSQRKILKNNKIKVNLNNNTQLLRPKNKFQNSSLDKKCTSNDRRIREKRVHRGKNTINLKNKKGSPTPKRKIIKKQEPNKKTDLYFILRDNQLNSNKNEHIIYGPIGKIDSINYQNNNINNFYIIHDNNDINHLNMNKTLKKPNFINRNYKKDVIVNDSSKIDKNNLTFNKYNINLTRTKSLNKTKKEVTLKYFINNNRMRNNSCNDKISENISGNIITSNEIPNQNYNINKNNVIFSNRYNNIGGQLELSKNTISKNSDSRMINGDSDLNSKECELNITPKKKKNLMRINPIKLLGDFKKEFKRYSKNDKKNTNE